MEVGTTQLQFESFQIGNVQPNSIECRAEYRATGMADHFHFSYQRARIFLLAAVFLDLYWRECSQFFVKIANDLLFAAISEN